MKAAGAILQGIGEHGRAIELQNLASLAGALSFRRSLKTKLLRTRSAAHIVRSAAV